jgi:flagellar motor switch protein FliM
MEPILSKQEIADLLRTLQKDGTGTPGPVVAGARKISAEHFEINLLELPADSQKKSDIPNFSLIIERFRNSFGRSLSHYLQKKVSLEIIDFHSLPFSDYLPDHDHHKTTGILSLKPLSSGCLINYDSHLWFLLLENLLGGLTGAASASSDRSPTKLELNLLKTSMELACRAIEQAFSAILQLSSRVIETTSVERLHSFTSPDSTVTVYRFKAELEEEAGVLELVFPTDSLVPYRASLAKLTQLQNFENKNWPDSIRDGLSATPITVTAQACSIDLSIQQLLNLKVGDILPIPHDPDSSVEILVEGIAKFSGLPGQKNHNKNVKIINVYQ